ncbi:hypothetical protein Pyn_16555 [Prunus yedoensis var. nudiflora]|uniref:Uncharacterized protein n=1 Tax=Prunus yedoensis var. nudiflora TaxID=2094558 RepID=A0A314U6Z4_PRUYE|nr:hypothetical protein Pyn_16555 [Prunus yedoensis var. nudiflora]
MQKHRKLRMIECELRRSYSDLPGRIGEAGNELSEELGLSQGSELAVAEGKVRVTLGITELPQIYRPCELTRGLNNIVEQIK